MTERAKIAILGGGPAGLAAAWQLTHTDGWQDRYDVTVYQQGWRCGGKCATGRGPMNRIQEHGIHVLMGSYDSVFTILEDVYGARAEYGVAPESPFATWQDAFQRIDATLLTDSSDPTLVRWIGWPIVFPQNDLTPAQGPPTPLWVMLKDVVGTGLTAILGSPYASHQGPIRRWILSWFFPDEPTLTGAVAQLADAIYDEESLASQGLERLLDGRHTQLHARAKTQAASLASNVGSHAEGMTTTSSILDFLSHLLEGFERWSALVDDMIQRDLAIVEFALVALRGILADCWDPGAGGFDFSRIDHLDLREWLRSHGGSQRCLWSSPVRFLYAGTFSNLIGGEGGLFAAGTAMQSIFTMLAYKGSLVWQMRAGTGDTMIAPIVQVLEARGVRFEYFHRVANVHDSGDGIIRKIDVTVQARVTSPPYRPFVPVQVQGGVVDAWPDRPLFDQLDPDDAKAIQQYGWESECARVPGHPTTLEYGVDFTHVVLATPVATLPHLAPEIVARVPSWKRTVELVKTTPTQNFQVWFPDDNVTLGVPLDAWGLNRPNLVPNAETYADTFTAWADASVTAPFEGWPTPPGAISYFCGAYELTAPYDEMSQADWDRELEGVAARAQQWTTDNMGWIFRKARTKEQPFGLDYRRLLAPDPTKQVTPKQKWVAQFFRANADPTEQYTLTLPKTIQERVQYDDTGFENLVLAGDWVGHEGINAGFVDGAMLCGRQAGLEMISRLGFERTREPAFHADVVRRGGRRG